MPLEMTGSRAILHGHAAIDDAEALLDWLRGQDRPVVRVADCPSAHMAVLQVILAARPALDLGDAKNDWRQLLRAAALPQADTESNENEYDSGR